MEWKKISSSSSSNTNNKNDTNDLCFLISQRKITNIGCSFEVQCSHTYGNNSIDNFNFSNCIKCFGNHPPKQSRKTTENQKSKMGKRRGSKRNENEIYLYNFYVSQLKANWRATSLLCKIRCRIGFTYFYVRYHSRSVSIPNIWCDRSKFCYHNPKPKIMPKIWHMCK